MPAHARAVLPISMEDQPAALPGLKSAHISERRKEAILNMRIPAELRDLAKARAHAGGISLACYVRLVLEEAVTGK